MASHKMALKKWLDARGAYLTVPSVGSDVYCGTCSATRDGRPSIALQDGIYCDRKCADTVPCECGRATGTACEWSGPHSETVIVDWMPEYLRKGHHAARNHGVWPYNGALRLRVEASCAERLRESADEMTGGCSGCCVILAEEGCL